MDDYVGYEGARLAHKEFWKLLTEGHSIDAFGAIFEMIFISVGWLANELYLIGLVAFLFQRRIAVRLFALAFSIMISWHLAFLDEFPLLIGYWFWVLAGGIAFYLAASRRAEDIGVPAVKIIMEPVTLALLLFPVLNALIVAGTQV